MACYATVYEIVKIIVQGRKIFMFMAPLRYHRNETEASTKHTKKESFFPFKSVCVCVSVYVCTEDVKEKKKINSQFISRDYKHSFFNKTCTAIFGLKCFICLMCVCV